MPSKTAKPKDTPEAEYKRFLETARQVEAEETPEAFDRAFTSVASAGAKKKHPSAPT